MRLQAELRAGTWRPGTPSQHEVMDPKHRVITAAPFEDRIVHQALAAEIGPLLERGLIADSFACRVGRGTHAALRRARAWARGYRYGVHLDVVKYFPSVDHIVPPDVSFENYCYFVNTMREVGGLEKLSF